MTKPSYCPACGRNLALVGIAHQCGFPVPRQASPQAIAAEEPEAVDLAKQPFDKTAYQREYMRKRRQAQKTVAYRGKAMSDLSPEEAIEAAVSVGLSVRLPSD